MLLDKLSLTGSVLMDSALVAVAVYLFYAVRSYSRLSHIPGPKVWAWTWWPLLRTHLYGEIYDTFGDLNDKYGPLVRVAPNTLLCADPDIIRKMSAVKSPYTRSLWYLSMRLIPGEDNVLSVLDDPRHDERRRKMGMAYSGKENTTLEPDIDDCVHDLVNLLDAKYVVKPGSEPVHMDLARKVQFFTSDVMSKLSFDMKFHDLRDDNDNMGYIHELETIFPSISCTCVIPKFLDFLTKTGILGKLAPSDTSKFGLGKILAISKEQVAKRFDSDGKIVSVKPDMLGSFLRHGITQKEAEQETVMQLGAGSDTTATGIRGTMLCLMNNPRVYAKLRAEIDAAIADGRISSDPNEIIRDSVARDLPYLQACIKEGLRFLPPAGAMLSKQVPPEGDTVCGYFVPGGTNIAHSAKALHHQPKLFGPDEMAFRPERLIHTSQGGDEPSWEKIKALEKNTELVFGHGKYQCLGKNVAAVELNKVIAELARRYEMSLVDPLKPWETSCYGIHFQKNMWVVVKRRGEGSASTNEKEIVDVAK